MYHDEAVASLVSRGRSLDRLSHLVSEYEGLPMRVLSAHDRPCIQAGISSILSAGEQVGRA